MEKATNFAASKKNSFAYKLEGFNKDWVYTSNDNRIATYTNLEPGDYVFRCRTVDNKGIAQPLPRPFKKSGRAFIEQISIQVKTGGTEDGEQNDE